ncbi:MAG: CBS domain-containing protein [Tissierellia bacterium]|nr:CBS domain-containing protein [Tissierellia bacterium]
MFVRAIMTPAEDLITIRSNNTLKEALNIILEEGFLSLPVVDGDTFVGYISKMYIYEKFIESGEKEFDTFLLHEVRYYAFMDMEPVSDSTYIEEAAEAFFRNKVMFIPVVDRKNHFQGIVTQRSLFEVVLKVFGLKDAKITIYSQDFSGSLYTIVDVIRRHGSNITNIAQYDLGVLGTQEISIRVEEDDPTDLVEKLKSKGIKVREFQAARK